MPGAKFKAEDEDTILPHLFYFYSRGNAGKMKN